MDQQELLCAIDLGSNSFRLMIGRVDGDQIYPLDNLKESVRLAAGLGSDRVLDEAAQQRGIDALTRFAQRLRGFPVGAVRAVATNTLRVAKNASDFLLRAQDALGFPIEVIAGREEARLIYVGVAHTLPNPERQQLVVDIGGGSTEFIIGRNFEPLALESLYMGCVSYSLRYFPDGRIERSALREAELAARQELQAISSAYRKTGWELAVGSSGSAKAACDVLELNGFSDGGITAEGLRRLNNQLLKVKHIDELKLEGLKSDRIPVFLGGFAILSAIFKEFELSHMVFSEGALRQGVLYDLLGRYHRHDLRDATVKTFLQRYQVDRKQAQRVTQTAQRLFGQLHPDNNALLDERRFLSWSAQLHEVGLSIAHASYHKHSAYVLANADMPGFSKMDQGKISRLALAHRGKLERLQAIDPASHDWDLIVCLRLAALIHRARDSATDCVLQLQRDQLACTPDIAHYVLHVSAEWLRAHPLTAAALHEEEAQWQKAGRSLRLKVTRARQSSTT